MVNLNQFKSLLFVLLWAPLIVKAELVVEVTQGLSEPTPVAVVPFKWTGQGALPEDVAQIVDQDLSRSGLFTTLPRSAMLSLPSERSQVFFRDWRMTKSDFLVVGKLSPSQRLALACATNFMMF